MIRKFVFDTGSGPQEIAFKPWDINGLRVWLDAAKGVIIDNAVESAKRIKDPEMRNEVIQGAITVAESIDLIDGLQSTKVKSMYHPHAVEEALFYAARMADPLVERSLIADAIADHVTVTKCMAELWRGCSYAQGLERHAQSGAGRTGPDQSGDSASASGR